METLDIVVDKDRDAAIEAMADALIKYCIENGLDPNKIFDLKVTEVK